MRRIYLLVLALLSLPAHAVDPWAWEKGSGGNNTFEGNFDDDTKPWKEVAAQLPAYPKADNLISITVGATSANQFFVDYPSVSADNDGVVRYTILIRSPSGAETVNYEGLRCTTGERKMYAFGHPGGEWSRNRYAKWEPIQARNQKSYRRELFYHYFCTVDAAANLAKIQFLLKSGGFYGQD